MIGTHLAFLGLNLNVTHASYTLCLFVMWWLMREEFLRKRIILAEWTFTKPRKKSIKLTMAGLIILFGGIAWLLGAKIGRAVEQFGIRSIFEYPTKTWRNLDGTNGLAGLIAAVIVVVIITACLRQLILKVLDGVAPALATGYAIGRIGCFAAGHCFGLPTTMPWGVHDPLGYYRYNLVHPTPIYEALGASIIFAFLWLKRTNRQVDGKLFGYFLWGLGIGRFMIEMIRRNPTGLWGLSQAQWIALLMILLGLVLVNRKFKSNLAPA